MPAGIFVGAQEKTQPSGHKQDTNDVELYSRDHYLLTGRNQHPDQKERDQDISPLHGEHGQNQTQNHHPHKGVKIGDFVATE